MMENPIRMDDLGGGPIFLVQHPSGFPPFNRSSTATVQDAHPMLKFCKKGTV